VAERGMGVGVIWRHDKHEIVIKPCRGRVAVLERDAPELQGSLAQIGSGTERVVPS
jgi:hypothetical protein